MKDKNIKTKHELLSLMNVGPATLKDLKLLEIESIAELARACPDELFSKLQKITGWSHDPYR